MICLINYQRIETLLIFVVMLATFVVGAVSGNFVIVRELSVDHCNFGVWWILGVPMIRRAALRKSGDVCKASREVRTSSYIDLVYSADSQG